MANEISDAIRQVDAADSHARADHLLVQEQNREWKGAKKKKHMEKHLILSPPTPDLF